MKWKNEYKILWILYTHVRVLFTMGVIIVMLNIQEVFVEAFEEPGKLAGLLLWAGMIIYLIRYVQVPKSEDYPWVKEKHETKNKEST